MTGLLIKTLKQSIMKGSPNMAIQHSWLAPVTDRKPTQSLDT